MILKPFQKVSIFCVAAGRDQTLDNLRFTGQDESGTSKPIENEQAKYFVNYAAARYYELLLFKNLQDFCNRNGRNAERGKTEELIMLIFEHTMRCDAEHGPEEIPTVGGKPRFL